MSICWLDCEVAVTNQPVTFLFRKRPSLKMLDFCNKLRESSAYMSFIGTKTLEPGVFHLLRLDHAGIALGRRQSVKHQVTRQHAQEENLKERGCPARARHARTTRNLIATTSAPLDVSNKGMFKVLLEALPKELKKMQEEESQRLFQAASAGGRKIWDTPEKKKRMSEAIRKGRVAREGEKKKKREPQPPGTGRKKANRGPHGDRKEERSATPGQLPQGADRPD